MENCLVSFKEGKLVMKDQFVLTSAKTVLDMDHQGFNNFRMTNMVVYTKRPKMYNLHGWYKLIKAIYKHVPEED